MPTARAAEHLAGRAELPAESADLVRERDQHGDHRTERRLDEIRRLGHRCEGVRPGADLLVVAKHVVRDPEHGERGDAGDES